MILNECWFSGATPMFDICSAPFVLTLAGSSCSCAGSLLRLAAKRCTVLVPLCDLTLRDSWSTYDLTTWNTTIVVPCSIDFVSAKKHMRSVFHHLWLWDIAQFLSAAVFVQCSHYAGQNKSQAWWLPFFGKEYEYGWGWVWKWCLYW